MRGGDGGRVKEGRRRGSEKKKGGGRKEPRNKLQAVLDKETWSLEPRDNETDRQTETETETETDRQRDRNIQRDKDRQTETDRQRRERDRQTDRDRENERGGVAKRLALTNLDEFPAGVERPPESEKSEEDSFINVSPERAHSHS